MNESKRIILKYLIHVLEVIDKAFVARIDLIRNVNTKNETLLKLFKAKHGITTDQELIEWRDIAIAYTNNIAVDMNKRIGEMPIHELMQIMNDESACYTFLEKYKVSEEDLKNDCFFQCG